MLIKSMRYIILSFVAFIFFFFIYNNTQGAVSSTIEIKDELDKAIDLRNQEILNSANAIKHWQQIAESCLGKVTTY